MGQRSQIYVRYTKDGKHYLTARYFQWNYGERMISRCRYSLEWIEKTISADWYFTKEKTRLERILDVNFDMADVQLGCDIVKEFLEYGDDYSFIDYIFKMQDNNDGKLFIDISDGQPPVTLSAISEPSFLLVAPVSTFVPLKYCFLDCDCNTENIMDAAGYMAWNSENWEQSKYIDDEQKERCRENLKVIGKIAELMTTEEAEDFINCIYEEEPKPF